MTQTYTSKECLDMICLYIENNYIATSAARMYAERYGDKRRTPSSQTIVKIFQSLQENGSFSANIDRALKRTFVGAYVHPKSKYVLRLIRNDPNISTTQIRRKYKTSTSSIYRIIKDEEHEKYVKIWKRNYLNRCSKLNRRAKLLDEYVPDDESKLERMMMEELESDVSEERMMMEGLESDVSDDDKPLITMSTKPKITKAKTTSAKGPKTVHEGVECKYCAKTIVGHRYRCLQCETADICVECVMHGHHSALNHCMLVIPDPKYYAVFDYLQPVKSYLLFLKNEPVEQFVVTSDEIPLQRLDEPQVEYPNIKYETFDPLAVLPKEEDDKSDTLQTDASKPASSVNKSKRNTATSNNTTQDDQQDISKSDESTSSDFLPLRYNERRDYVTDINIDKVRNKRKADNNIGRESRTADPISDLTEVKSEIKAEDGSYEDGFFVDYGSHRNKK